MYRWRGVYAHRYDPVRSGEEWASSATPEGAINDAELDVARRAVALCPSGALSLFESADNARVCESREH